MRDDARPVHDARPTADDAVRAGRPVLGRRSRPITVLRRVALLGCAGLMIAGCSATGEPHGKLTDGLRMPFSWTSSKSNEEAFKKAVQNDSFPTAAEVGV